MKPGVFFTLILFWGLYLNGKESSIHQYYEPVESEKVNSFIQASLQKLQKEFGDPRYKIKEVHIRRSKLRENPEQITSLDILDWQKLLKNITSVISPDELANLKNQTDSDKSFRASLLKHINSLILNEDLIEKQAFKTVTLNSNEKKWRGDGFFGCFSEDRIRLNRSVINRLLGNSLIHFESFKKLKEGRQSCEIHDLKKGIFVIYLKHDPETEEFYSELGHEIFHLLDPLCFDWVMEGLASVFSEEACQAHGYSWDIWKKKFAKNYESEPYAASYFMVMNLKKIRREILNNIKSCSKYEKVSNKYFIDLNNWLSDLNELESSKSRVVLNNFMPTLQKYKNNNISVLKK